MLPNLICKPEIQMRWGRLQRRQYNASNWTDKALISLKLAYRYFTALMNKVGVVAGSALETIANSINDLQKGG